MIKTEYLRRPVAQLSLAAILLMLSICIPACIDLHSWQKDEGMIWNTMWHATYYGDSDMIADAIDSLIKVEQSISVFDHNSLISKINKSSHGPVDRHLTKVYNMAKAVSHASNGMFDPTVSPLIEAWGFGENRTPTNDTALVRSLLPIVGIDKTYIQDGILHKESPDMKFNFSALAKGYGVDVAAQALRDRGCTDLMLEIGGEIVCFGNNPEGHRWRILIETPDREFLKEAFGSDKMPTFRDPLIIELSDEALATSGNYRNYHISNGEAFGHTISPRTGMPVKSDILSASVVAPTCMEADAMATACMALGSEEGMALLLEKGLPGAFILYSGDVLLNQKMSERIATK